MQTQVRPGEEKKLMIEAAYFISSVDHDVRATEKAGDGRGMGVEKTLLGLGYTITAPVDLHKFRQLALHSRGQRRCKEAICIGSGVICYSRSDPSLG